MTTERGKIRVPASQVRPGDLVVPPGLDRLAQVAAVDVVGDLVIMPLVDAAPTPTDRPDAATPISVRYAPADRILTVYRLGAPTYEIETVHRPAPDEPKVT